MALPTTNWSAESSVSSQWVEETLPGVAQRLVTDDGDLIVTDGGLIFVTDGEAGTDWTDE